MTTASPDTAPTGTTGLADKGARSRHGRRRVIAAGVIIALIGAGVGVWVADPFSATGPSQTSVVDSADPTSLATVTQRSLSSQTEVPGTLGYAGGYTVVVPVSGGGSTSAGPSTGPAQPSTGGQSSGTFTALPTAGQVVSQGQSLYSISLSPVVLLYGTTPASRDLSEGITGPDVLQLNADLVALGEATSSQLDPTSDYFSAATATALEKLQAHLGVAQTGSLNLGQAVFLPTAAKITAVEATLGAPTELGAQVLQATSTTRQVVVNVDTTQQSDVAVGDQVAITLPDGQTTLGKVSAIGTVATSSSPAAGGGAGTSTAAGGSSSSAGNGSSASTPTIEVDVTPGDPSATGNLDQAPVEVTISTASVKNALVVPVTALVALANGGYAVEVAVTGARNLVPVTLGLFDDADGLVQVQGSGLSAGQRVVIPTL